MVLLRICCSYVRDIWSPAKQGHLKNYQKSLSVDVATISESRLSDPRDLIPLFSRYEMFLSLCRSRAGSGGIEMLSRKSLGLKMKAVFLDPHSKLVVFDMSSSDNSVLRLVAGYVSTGQGGLITTSVWEFSWERFGL